MKVLLCLLLICVIASDAYHPSKIKLKDIEALTLKSGRMTTGRRSAPVNQLQCVNGCSGNLPQVVQCINKGFDGYSVQWECKADLDRDYKFGELIVTCEGFDYADDPYVLVGSCGLEYSLVRSSDQNYYSNQQKNYGWNSDIFPKTKHKDSLSGIFIFLVIALIIYVLYKTCLSPSYNGPGVSSTDDDRPSSDNYPNMGWNVPGSGSYRGGAYRGDYDSYDASCGSNRRRNGGGGFWTGLATGGALGYLFGNTGGRNRNYYNDQYDYGQSTFSSGGYRRSSGGDSGSSTRTSTGFAETRRR